MLAVLTAQVFHQWNCDHFGHVNTRAYAAAFDDAIFAFWAGMRDAAAQNVIAVTAEMKTSFVAEAGPGTVFEVRGRVGRVGTKSTSLRLEMTTANSREVLATCDAVEVFFDPSSRKSAAIPDDIRTRLTALVHETS